MFENRAGKVLTDILLEWKIDHLYGIPGDSINNLVEALRKEQDKLSFIQVRHEEVGALAAAAYAKLTGKIGVCLSIAGPGAVHLLNGLYDAKLDKAPVLVLAGQVENAKIGTDAFQEINLERMFDDVAVFNKRVSSPDQMPDLTHQAIRTAYAEKGVAVLTIPDNIPLEKVKNSIKLRSDAFSEPEIFPYHKQLNKAMPLLQEAKRPVILAGKGAQNARKELDEFANKMAAPVIVSLPGKGILPDLHSHNLGNLGLIGTKPSYEAMEETDLLIMIGTSFPYRDFLPKDASAIQIDIRAEEIGKRYPVDVGLVGDAKLTLKWLNEHIDQHDDQFLKACQENKENWLHHINEDKREESTPIKPHEIISALEEVTADDAVLSTDVGNVTVWMARYFQMKEDQRFVISSSLATMGCGLPGAIGAKLAYPDRQAVAVCGDGGFSMVMQDFVTAVRYKLPMMVIIFNNERLGMIKFEQEEAGHLEYKTKLANINYAEFAKSCGGEGFLVEEFSELKPALQQAAYATKPVIVDIIIEEQPPLPGKIEYQQAAGYTKHMIKEFFEKGKVNMPPLKKVLKRM